MESPKLREKKNCNNPSLLQAATKAMMQKIIGICEAVADSIQTCIGTKISRSAAALLLAACASEAAFPNDQQETEEISDDESGSANGDPEGETKDAGSDAPPLFEGKSPFYFNPSAIDFGAPAVTEEVRRPVSITSTARVPIHVVAARISEVATSAVSREEYTMSLEQEFPIATVGPGETKDIFAVTLRPEDNEPDVGKVIVTGEVGGKKFEASVDIASSVTGIGALSICVAHPKGPAGECDSPSMFYFGGTRRIPFDGYDPVVRTAILSNVSIGSAAAFVVRNPEVRVRPGFDVIREGELARLAEEFSVTVVDASGTSKEPVIFPYPLVSPSVDRDGTSAQVRVADSLHIAGDTCGLSLVIPTDDDLDPATPPDEMLVPFDGTTDCPDSDVSTLYGAECDCVCDFDGTCVDSSGNECDSVSPEQTYSCNPLGCVCSFDDTSDTESCVDSSGEECDPLSPY